MDTKHNYEKHLCPKHWAGQCQQKATLLKFESSPNDDVPVKFWQERLVFKLQEMSAKSKIGLEGASGKGKRLGIMRPIAIKDFLAREEDTGTIKNGICSRKVTCLNNQRRFSLGSKQR